MDAPVTNSSSTRMRWVRRLHLYLSCFFAPLLMFFVLTGWYQTVAGRRNRKLLEGESDWFWKFRSVHVEQFYPSPNAEGYEPWFFKAMVVGMAVALLVTVGLGIYLAFRTSKKPWRVGLALILGIAFPVLFLWLGQRTRS